MTIEYMDNRDESAEDIKPVAVENADLSIQVDPDCAKKELEDSKFARMTHEISNRDHAASDQLNNAGVFS